MYTCEFCWCTVRRDVYTHHIVTEHNQPKPEGYVAPDYQEQSKWVYTDGEIIGLSSDYKEVINGK